jgi:hypothetical protein
MTRAEVLKTMRGPKYPLIVRLSQFIYEAHMLGLDRVEVPDEILTPKVTEELEKAGYDLLHSGGRTTIIW